MHDEQPVTEWGLQLRKKGLRWQEDIPCEKRDGDDTITIQVEPGGTYRIVLDTQNSPLTPAETDLVTRTLFDAIEHLIPKKKIWPWVAEKLPNLVKGRTVEQLSNIYDCPDHGLWRDWYKPIVPAPHIQAGHLEAHLSSGQPYRIDVYYRALDRFPGGNADMHTVCYRFTPNCVTCFEHCNWDGDQHAEDFCPPKLNSHVKEVVSSVIASILECAKQSGVNSECTIKDMIAMDSDEYDTEWTSVEIAVMVPLLWSPETHSRYSVNDRTAIRIFLLVNARLGHPFSRDVLHSIFRALVSGSKVELWHPLFRLHQYSVPGIKQYGWAKKGANKTQDHIEPSATQATLLSCVNKSIGMGRVNQFSDAGDGEEPCAAAKDKEKGKRPREKGLGSYSHVPLPYLQPIYFRADWEGCNESNFVV